MHLCCPPWHTGCLTWRREQEAQAALVEGRAELAAVSAHTRRSLAAMRWKLATAVIGSRSQMSIVRLPTLANGVPSAMPGAAPVPGVVKDAAQQAPATSGVVAV